MIAHTLRQLVVQVLASISFLTLTVADQAAKLLLDIEHSDSYIHLYCLFIMWYAFGLQLVFHIVEKFRVDILLLSYFNIHLLLFAERWV